MLTPITWRKKIPEDVGQAHNQKAMLIFIAIEIAVFCIPLIFDLIGLYFALILGGYLIAFPCLYCAITAFYLKYGGSLLIYSYSLVPTFAVILAAFLYDGMTTAQTNPDSSMYLWTVFFTAGRAVVLAVLFLGLFLFYAIRKHIKKVNKNNA